MSDKVKRSEEETRIIESISKYCYKGNGEKELFDVYPGYFEVPECEFQLVRKVGESKFSQRRQYIDNGAAINGAMNYANAKKNMAIGAVMYSRHEAGYSALMNRDELDEDEIPLWMGSNICKKFHHHGEFFLLKNTWLTDKFIINKNIKYVEDLSPGIGGVPDCMCRFFYKYHLDQIPDGVIIKKKNESDINFSIAIKADEKTPSEERFHPVTKKQSFLRRLFSLKKQG
ncbi:hypothetical protein [Saccharibacter floricola]|uniref:Uncharacterized protein n=1 Tax=Saccharibacter floricola DSM 15669 TaxID=1123227 RepID=A0ABQ0NZN9_9PROT|nr:hypothetical protein [Saccharibacter floricola]GBQ07504.1 hypothetical protein AA15669_1407 [Saccharibacter floricola DSM 15669]